MDQLVELGNFLVIIKSSFALWWSVSGCLNEIRSFPDHMNPFNENELYHIKSRIFPHVSVLWTQYVKIPKKSSILLCYAVFSMVLDNY